MVLRPNHQTESIGNHLETSEAEAPFDVAIQEAQKILISGQEFVERVNNLEIQLTRNITEEVKEKLATLAADAQKSIEEWQTLAKALEVANEPLSEELEKLSPKARKKLNTSYEDRSSTENQKNVELLDPEMKTALLIGQEIMSEAEFPNFCFGSVPNIMEHGQKIGRKPKDSDRLGAIQDFPKAFAKAKSLEKDNRVKSVEVIEMSDPKGGKNKCFELKVQAVHEDKTTEVSIFFQNPDKEKPKNGRVNAGIEQTHVVYYNINGVQVPFADRATNEKMYARSALYEIGLFDSKIYKDRKDTFPYVDAKALKRFVDLMVAYDFNFDKVVEVIKNSVDENTEQELKDAVEVVKWLQNEWQTKKFNAEGLVAQTCNREEPHCEEKAIDALAVEIKEDIGNSFTMWQNSETAFENGDLEEINNIDSQIAILYQKYEDKKRLLNSSHQIDSIAYIGIRSIEHNFLFKIVLDLDDKKKKLKAKMKLKN